MTNLIEKLPHKAPALLIDEVLDIGPDGATCGILKRMHPSVAKDGLLPAPMGLEAMAQAAAVWMAWAYTDKPNEGMLVQCRDFKMHARHFDISTGLRAFAKPKSVGSATGLYQFSGSILSKDGTALATASFLILVKTLSA